MSMKTILSKLLPGMLTALALAAVLLFSSCGGDDPAPPPTISAPAVTGTFQPEGELSISFATTGTFEEGNNFVVQLSDAAGNFSTPTVLTSSTSSAAITATLPANLADGKGYRIRIVSTAPVITSADNGADLSIAKPTLAVTSFATLPNAGLPYISGRQITVSSTVTGVFKSDNKFKLQLSDASGSFEAPIQLAEVTSVSNGITTYIASKLSAGTGYRLRIISTSPAVVGTPSEPFTVVIPTLATPAISGNLVAGGQVTLTGGGTPGAWLGDNLYYIQLSDASGNFSNGFTVYSVYTNFASIATPSITYNLPSNLAPGTGYRLRAVATSPSVISATSAAFTVGALPTLKLEVSTPAFTKLYNTSNGGSPGNQGMWYVFKVSKTGSINPNAIFYLQMSGPNRDFTTDVDINYALSTTQANDLINTGSCLYNFSMANWPAGNRKFRIITINHSNVVSNELTFGVSSLEVTSLTASIANVSYNFTDQPQIRNLATTGYPNNQMYYLTSAAVTTTNGAAVLRVFIYLPFSNENIKTGSQEVNYVVLFYDATGKILDRYSTKSTMTISGSASGYTGSIGALTLSRTSDIGVGNGPSTLSLQSSAFAFRVQ